MKIRLCLALFLTVAPAWAGFTFFHQTEVGVYANVSPDGGKIEHPDPSHPVYYLPILGRFMSLGEPVRVGGRTMSEREIAHRVAFALAREGYYLAHPGLRVNAAGEIAFTDGTVVRVPEFPDLRRPIVLNQPGDVPLTLRMIESRSGPYSFNLGDRVGSRHTLAPILQVMRTLDPVHGTVMQATPQIVIVVQYGLMGGTLADLGSGDGGIAAVGDLGDFNVGPMVALLAGGSTDLSNPFTLDFWQLDNDLISRTKADRYFAIVTAYDFKGFLRHKRILLWRTRMSVPSTMGLTFAETLPLMIEKGERYFGRPSAGPTFTEVPVSRGRVEIGEPRVIDYQVPPAPPPDVGPDRFMPFHFGAKSGGR